nr:hypothetical protein [Akkermansiaceae bacterium]
MEAARTLAQRALKEGGKSAETRSAYAFELVTARPPSPLEQNTLAKVYQKAFTRYLTAPEQATQLLKVGEAKRDESLPIAEHAAMTIVASTI